jgi:riboflavin synthase
VFTGLVEGLGKIIRLQPKGPDATLWINPPWPAAECVLGESVAVNGACLTVTEVADDGFAAGASAETLSRTTLGRLGSGAPVNLERALRLGDRLGGHLVSGHVDCVGQVRDIRRLGSSLRLKLEMEAAYMRLVAEKGSITIDGVSLTVNQLEGAGFNVNIIPHTAAATTLQLVKTGGYVNIETDLIAKYLEKLTKSGRADASLSLQELARMGY